MSHNFDALPDFNIETKKLSARLARNEEEVRLAQAIRYQVFYDELKAIPSEKTKETKLDQDENDPYCDHLILYDVEKSKPGSLEIIGTYRFLREERALEKGGFYSEGEFDLSSFLKNRPEKKVEVGRSCILKPYRGVRSLQLMWHAIGEYRKAYDIQILFGCSSFHGTDATRFKQALAYLHKNCLAPAEYRPKALPEFYVNMEGETDFIDEKAVWDQLPPLLKGYLRFGGWIGEGAVVDQQFNTTDVFIALETRLATEKYVQKFFQEKPAPSFTSTSF